MVQGIAALIFIFIVGSYIKYIPSFKSQEQPQAVIQLSDAVSYAVTDTEISDNQVKDIIGVLDIRDGGICSQLDSKIEPVLTEGQFIDIKPEGRFLCTPYRYLDNDK